MRLSETERSVIVDSLRSQFPDVRRIALFGSRADDSKRGGDIDLLVVSDLSYADAFRASLSARAAIQIGLGGERKIDMVVSSGTGDDRLIVKEAMRTGIDLWTK